DEEARLFTASVDAFARTYQITKNQYSAGTANAADVAQALTQLEATRAQLVNVGVLRAQDEHAIAVLIGKAPADFAIPPYPEPLNAPVVVVPPGVPSTLLERRPDIAAAERQVASANAQIGVAIAGYYPDVTLSASYGFASPEIGKLLAL